MATITSISESMQNILGPGANRLAWQTGFSRRQSELCGSAFMQALVFSCLGTERLTFTQLNAAALDAGAAVTNQAIDQRFSPTSAALAQAVLAESLRVIMTPQPATPGLLARFAGVYVRDSSVVSLPAELGQIWPGVGNLSGPTAGVKLQVRLELKHGQLGGPIVQAARAADSGSPFQSEALPVGAVRLGDLAYFSLKQFAQDQSQGVYTCSRFKIGTKVYDHDGQAFDLLSWLRSQGEQPQVERSIKLGKRAQFACRLLAIRVPQQVEAQRRRKLREYARKKQIMPQAETLALARWTLIVTDVPPELLSIDEAPVLMATRWQIELLFKLWKSVLQIDQWRSRDPWRILTEFYAKLIAAVILHWTFLVGFWQNPHRSLWKAALIVRRFAPLLALAMPDRALLEDVLSRIQVHFRHVCKLERRKQRPSTAQRLLVVGGFIEH